MVSLSYHEHSGSSLGCSILVSLDVRSGDLLLLSGVDTGAVWSTFLAFLLEVTYSTFLTSGCRLGCEIKLWKAGFSIRFLFRSRSFSLSLAFHVKGKSSQFSCVSVVGVMVSCLLLGACSANVLVQILTPGTPTTVFAISLESLLLLIPQQTPYLN